MKGFEQLFMVHQPVRPIKVGIVNDEQQRKGKEEIKPAVLRNAGVKSGGPGNGWYMQYGQWHYRKDGNGDNGIHDLPNVIGAIRQFWLNLFVKNFMLLNDIKQKEKQAGYYKITAANHLHIMKIRLPHDLIP